MNDNNKVAVSPSRPLIGYAAASPLRRVYAIPSRFTFKCQPIRQMVKHYLSLSKVSIDPFARNNRWATYTNDINPDTAAEHHLDAEDFLKLLVEKQVKADLVILDPPYSPRQISECYKAIGRNVTMKDTQNAVLYARIKKHIPKLLNPRGIVISCGWNSSGMQSHGKFEIVEILLVNHGAARNDTIITIERMADTPQISLFEEAA